MDKLTFRPQYAAHRQDIEVVSGNTFIWRHSGTSAFFNPPFSNKYSGGAGADFIPPPPPPSLNHASNFPPLDSAIGKSNGGRTTHGHIGSPTST